MIKFLDLQKTNWQYQTEIEERLMKVFRSGWYLLGEEVTNFKNCIKAEEVIVVANSLEVLRLTI
ncbi:hypothetical protein [Apibacter sp. HY039]|uniref:hypothetical protein n=1 Tax=Apibacter sp. HY039 TaxID=2501476 RepID=UPI000FEBFD5A|nr:hypothetical protein [Apibacter sp. HY039]